MQVVIDIPEEMLEWVNDVNKFRIEYGLSDFIDVIKNGTPLPKGHGRLIDADYYAKTHIGGEMLKFAPTVLKAERGDN